MGFVGGGSNIAIATALPPFFMYCIVNSNSLWILDLLFLCLTEASVSGCGD